MRPLVTIYMVAILAITAAGCGSQKSASAPTAPPTGATQTPASVGATQVPTPAATPTPTAAPKGPEIGKVGQKVTSAGISLTVHSVKRTSDSGNQLIVPKQGNEYLVVEVTIENESRETSPYNPLYFKVKDSDSFEYNVSLMPMIGNALKSGELAQGEKARGTVTFEIPKTVKGLVLSYQPLVILGGYQPIRIKLED